MASVNALPRAARAVPVELEAIARRAEKPSTEERGARGVVKQPGRRLADGTRRGAREARRITFYLPVDVAEELIVRSARRNLNLSELATEVFAREFGMVVP